MALAGPEWLPNSRLERTGFAGRSA